MTEEEGASGAQPVRAVLNVLASTRTSIVLLALLAAAAMVGTILPDPTAQKYVYGQLWFHVLLGMLGLALVACMVWRKRMGMARLWSLLTHLGILLVLIGAMVTLVWAERGAIIIYEGQELDDFYMDGEGPLNERLEPLGFSVKLVDFRLAYYPRTDYVYVIRKDVRKHQKFPVIAGQALDIPGTEGRLTGLRLLPECDDGLVEAVKSDGTVLSAHAKVGATLKLGDGGLEVKVLRYEPSFKIDLKTKKVTSDSKQPTNPALQVVLVRSGAEKPEAPKWLFAKMPDFGHQGRGPKKADEVKLRFLHPSWPMLAAKAEWQSNAKGLRMVAGDRVVSPWDPDLAFIYQRVTDRVKEYESEVEVLEQGKVVRQHVIQVNSPLVHKGTKLSQYAYDQEGHRWSRLGVSRDTGVWFVYAGFVAMIVGLMGRFYVSPILRKMRSKQGAQGGDDGAA